MQLNYDPKDNEELSEQLSKCIAPADEALSIPPICYHSQDVLDMEIEKIFRGGWIGLGRSDLVSQSGDYVTLNITGVPIILVRDKQSTLHAFSNSCRHRAKKLLDGQGNCSVITCSFHSWTYGLDGRLIGAPHMQKSKYFNKLNYALIEFDAKERSGFIFINMSKDPVDIDEHLGDFEDLHSPWPLETLVSTRRQRFEVDCNWKAFIEVFNEYYHLKAVHPDSIDDVYEEPDPTDETTGAHTSQFGATSGTGGLLEKQQEHALPPMPGLAGESANGVRYSWIFPNMTFAAGKEAIWVYEALPLGPNRCEVFRTACFPPETIALDEFKDKAKQYYHRLDAALDEDIPVLVSQHEGLKSPYALAGPFSHLREGNVAAFAKWYAETMT